MNLHELLEEAKHSPRAMNTLAMALQKLGYGQVSNLTWQGYLVASSTLEKGRIKEPGTSMDTFVDWSHDLILVPTPDPQIHQGVEQVLQLMDRRSFHPVNAPLLKGALRFISTIEDVRQISGYTFDPLDLENSPDSEGYINPIPYNLYIPCALFYGEGGLDDEVVEAAGLVMLSDYVARGLGSECIASGHILELRGLIDDVWDMLEGKQLNTPEEWQAFEHMTMLAERHRG